MFRTKGLGLLALVVLATGCAAKRVEVVPALTNQHGVLPSFESQGMRLTLWLRTFVEAMKPEVHRMFHAAAFRQG